MADINGALPALSLGEPKRLRVPVRKQTGGQRNRASTNEVPRYDR